MRWSETAGRRAVAARSGGVCEVSGGRAEHMSHRKARSQMGAWSPSNILNISAGLHQWMHSNPVLARAGGWQLPSWEDTATAPVWLTSPWTGWFLLVDDPGDGGAHLVVPVDADLDPPFLQVFTTR